MEKYYLFGAGNNAWGVIEYFGKENIIAIIDNEPKKIGSFIRDIPVISLAQYIASESTEDIMITVAVYDSAEKQLHDAGIQNYYIAPMIQMGMATTSQFITDCGLCEKKNVVLIGYNPISRKLIRELHNNKLKQQISVVPQNAYETKRALQEKIKTIQYQQIKESDTVLILSEGVLGSDLIKSSDIYNIFDVKMDSNKVLVSQLSRWKDYHKGEDCFIIGNGPSMRIEDLEQLKTLGIPTFGMNLIFNIYKNTFWRPDYYTIAEYNVLRNYYNEMKELRPDNLFIKNFLYMKETPYIKGANYFPGCPKRNYGHRQKFSEDIAEVVYGGYSVMYDSLQIAIYMGFKRIYLLGADFSYLGDPAAKGNHFYDNAAEDKRSTAGIPYLDIAVNALMTAKKHAEKHRIEIYNATRGGKLEIFQRVNLDEFIAQQKGDRDELQNMW